MKQQDTGSHTALWKAVIERAFDDALKTSDSVRCRYIRRSAIDWFFMPEYAEDRKMVEDLSGEDLCWYIRRLKAAWKERYCDNENEHELLQRTA